MLNILFFLIFLILSACMVGPDYIEPAKPVTDHWEKDKSVKETPFKNVKWWEVFRDPTLTALICQGYQNNISAQIAGVRVLQARAQLAQSVGELYPQQQAMTGNYTYNRIGASSLQSILPQTFDTALLGFTANWELDFWGQYRRAIQSNNATFLASIAAYDNTLVTLTADIATAYINLRTLEEQIKVTIANIAVQKIALQIAQSRFKEGQTSLVDVEQAKTELSETQSKLPPLYSEMERQKNTLAFLLGLVPNSVDDTLKKTKGIPKAPETVAVGIPRETLERRPDIHQARMEAIAQSEAIGAIEATLYPSFSLSGTFAFTSNNIGNSSMNDIFNWSNRMITAGPGLNWSILNYGQITNAVRVQDAVFQGALLNYINLVLQAQKEVQDNIAAYIQSKKAEKLLVQANYSAIKTMKLTMLRYQEGETDFTPVLDAEQQQLRIQTLLTKAQGDIPLSLVALYRSLGGGWQIRNGNDIVPEQIKREMAARTHWGPLLRQPYHHAPRTFWEEMRQLYLPTW